MSSDAATFTGRRITWRGPVMPDIAMTAAYNAAFDRGERRPPEPGDRLTLRPGAQGIVGDLIRADATGHHYVLAFDEGFEIETDLPSTVVLIDGVQQGPPARQRTYAPMRTRPLGGVFRWLRRHRLAR